MFTDGRQTVSDQKSSPCEQVKNIKLNNTESYLVTFDVSSLYTNIPHSDGLSACGYLLERDNTVNSIALKS